ncbi:GAF and ANTAR domain-containing protein [Herbiconiux daphne]|uniref:GAF and ANTAR domain-containing protein n=1 Tax=Herbiconiux daphne TaxID=2970914 RepID=A0ABT2H6A5_9MICO|nr:GAF and ANTAR domain-containing protein [Herbiconiux daphne]MCS5735459.1 GAF and ANTAR domain-containing protein [Herbiconiux daphne]
MGTRSGFDAAMDALANAHRSRASLCDPFVDVLPVTGASISVLSRDFGTQTICASDRQAARLDELQFDLGVGPCWDAVSRHVPIIEPDVRNTTTAAWPPFIEAIQHDDVGALYAFPLVIGALDVGAVDLYSTSTGGLSPADIRHASSLASVAARQVLRRVVATDDSAEAQGDAALVDELDAAGAGASDFASTGFGSSRREIHQATGMVLAQLSISAEDALLLLRGRAYSSGRSLSEVANDVVERRLSFAPREDGEG